jgi:hypothetical protein
MISQYHLCGNYLILISRSNSGNCSCLIHQALFAQ